LTAQNINPIAFTKSTVPDGAFTTRYIARDSLEQIKGGSMSLEENIPDHFSEEKMAGRLVKDNNPD
jgi:hypothetical protein